MKLDVDEEGGGRKKHNSTDGMGRLYREASSEKVVKSYVVPGMPGSPGLTSHKVDAVLSVVGVIPTRGFAVDRLRREVEGLQDPK